MDIQSNSGDQINNQANQKQDETKLKEDIIN